MNDIYGPQDERGERHQARQLVGRELEMGRIREFLAAVRTDGGALLVTGEPEAPTDIADSQLPPMLALMSLEIWVALQTCSRGFAGATWSSRDPFKRRLPHPPFY